MKVEQTSVLRFLATALTDAKASKFDFTKHQLSLCRAILNYGRNSVVSLTFVCSKSWRTFAIGLVFHFLKKSEVIYKDNLLFSLRNVSLIQRYLIDDF